jgi:hypothetical protein
MEYKLRTTITFPHEERKTHWDSRSGVVVLNTATIHQRLYQVQQIGGARYTRSKDQRDAKTCARTRVKTGLRSLGRRRNIIVYRFNIVAGDQADVRVVWIGGLKLGLPPVGIVVLEYVEDIVLFERQLFLGVGFVVIEGYINFEERHDGVEDICRDAGARHEGGKGESNEGLCGMRRMRVSEGKASVWGGEKRKRVREKRREEESREEWSEEGCWKSRQ